MKLAHLISAAAVVLFAGAAQAQVTLDDFTAVTHVNHPDASPASNTWYDVQNNFSTASSSAGALLFDDGGFGNGIYIVYPTVVPATGNYTVSIDLLELTEDPANLNGIRALQLGVEVNGPHRGDSTTTLTASDDAVGVYGGTLAAGTNDSVTGTPAAVITTPVFAATAGDSLRIAISTDVATYNLNSGTWGGPAQIIFDNLVLTPVASVEDWMLH